ncbi:GNAT family acetyltransferase [Roseiarcus fermentans]|uniref:GNAT family acetyltransferase n=1 Tax=Roseiarcus fermentans TaxID=1473586 RepID=A0A366EK41_9HYPH|nr:GNAT family N-acetyltransferase [Roseiarcus fermentans]RBP02316.1 GNAT family acetyltransferase [Roseiarcus fermentans]
MSAISFRPYLPSDAARCAAIFRDAVEFSAADDYGDDQRAAWAARADDEAAFGAKLAGQLTIVATLDGFVVAFASLEGAEKLDMLYVDPAAGRQGVGAALVDAIARLAEGRGAKRLTAEASDVSKPLFDRLGFSAERRSLVQLEDQWLAHTTMTKALGESSSATRH